MSAFIVSNDHIDLLVSAITDARIHQAEWLTTLPGATSDIYNFTELGRALLRENTRSIKARYRGDDMGGTKQAETYTFKRITLANALKPVAIIKAANCFDYQACETSDYKTRWASIVMQRLIGHAVRSLPEYETAAWEYHRPHRDAA